MKENNGKGRKPRDSRRILLLSVVGSVLLAVFLLFRDDHHRSRGSSSSSPHRSAVLKSSLSTEQRRALEKQQLETLKNESPTLQDILLAKQHLVEVHVQDPQALARAPVGSYAGIVAEFCVIDWAIHKEDPASVGIFRFLKEQSRDCARPRRMDLKQVVNKARAFDAQNKALIPKVLNLTAVAFHESRCGSTLFANMAVAADPERHRVYSESHPPVFALGKICGRAFETCSLETAATILRDVVYLMSRSDDDREERVFFKIQSIGSNNIPVFQHAFPNTPWLYIYREPVQVMMSQLEHGDVRANCVQTRRNPPKPVESLLQTRGRSLRELTNVEYCAAHLGALTETAAQALDRNAYPVNYKDLPAAFYDKILPAIGYHVDADARQRMEDISKVYSKSMKGPKAMFVGDSEKKERQATPEIRDASALFLQDSYDKLEAAAAKRSY